MLGQDRKSLLNHVLGKLYSWLDWPRVPQHEAEERQDSTLCAGAGGNLCEGEVVRHGEVGVGLGGLAGVHGPLPLLRAVGALGQ